MSVENRLVFSNSQLPVEWYVDESIFEREMARFFANGPGYVGHQLMIPGTGDYRSAEWNDHGYLLFHDGEVGARQTAFWQLSNVCRHRQAIMLQGCGHLEGPIVCPVHRWAYDTKGQQLGAPRFPENPCLNLMRTNLENWNGLLFAGPRSANHDLEGMKLAPALGFEGYKLDHVELHTCHYNWKTFIEVYLEDYHVAPFHPGLGKFVTCDDLSWQFGAWYSVQRVGLNALENAGSAAYARWQKAVFEQMGCRGEAPPHGAIWLTYFPGTMVEWYPLVRVVSTLIPLAVDRTLNVIEFYYPEEIVDFEREFVEAERAAYLETAIEDDEIGERMDRGRRILSRSGRNEVGPYQEPLEEGMRHFHAFYRREMALEA